MLYNPAQMDKDELYDTFVARDNLLHELLETIENNTEKKSIQNIILLGARGIGKTHMLRIMENKVLDSRNLQSKWITVNVPEEQYGVFSLMDFFEYILKIVFHSGQLEKTNQDTYHKELKEIELNKNKESLDKIVSIFKDISQKENKQFLLLVDNIDQILAEKIRDEKELEYFRSILMTESFMMIIGTSTSIFEEIALYEKAFFRFFKTIHLQNLNNKEVEELLLKRARFDQIDDEIRLNENRNKIKAITDLTGGYPRLVLMLYEIIEDKPLLDVLKTFNRLLDNLTPYYKHRMDDLAPQQQKIIDTIMQSDGVASPTDIAKMVGWKPNVVTSQFKRLKDLNILQIKESQEVKKKKTIYEISDRLFVIWYQMRYLGVLRRRIEYIVTFLKIWYDLGELKDKISSYASQYQHHYSMGNFSESYGYARSISIISNAITKVSEKEKIIFEQIKRYIEVGKLEDALKEQTELLKIHVENDNRQGIASDYANMGIVYKIKGELDKALEYYEKALKLNEEIGSKEWIALMFGNMGIVCQTKGELDKALEYHRKALELNEEIENKKGIASTFGKIGNVYQIKGKLDEALEYYRKALKLNKEIVNKEGIASQFGNMGIVYRIKGELDKALEYYKKALEQDDEIGSKEGIASQFGNMGIVYGIKGELDEALEYFERALKLNEEIGSKTGIALLFGNIGNVYGIKGELDEALKYHRKALKLNEEIGSKEGIASQFGNMGNVYQIKGELDEALEYYGKALKLNEEIGNKEMIALLFGNIGIVYKIKGELDEAQQYYQKALKIFKDMGGNLNYNITNNKKISLLLKSAITHSKEKNTGLAVDNIEAIAKSLNETKNDETIKIIVSSIFELLKDCEYDFAITIIEMFQKEHDDIFEICEPFLISAKYLKTNNPDILENTSSIVLEGVKKILDAVKK